MKKQIAVALFAGLLGMAACNKTESTTEQPKIQFILTDGPAAYDAVNINIQSIKINTGAADTENSWVDYPITKAGMYDLLKLKNGGYVTMGEPMALPAGKISQIRMVLGDGNTVVIEGTPHALTTPSAQQSGLKINLNQTLDPNGVYKIWLDFDAARSIVSAGNSWKYILKPVIKAVTESANFGVINGFVLPSEAKATVFVLKNGVDTVASAIPEASGSPLGEGYFKVMFLEPGSYSVSLNAHDATNYKDSTITNVPVVAGKVTSTNHAYLRK